MDPLLWAVVRAYRVLLWLYPRDYRPFADEMRDVFLESLSEAAGCGPLSLCATCLRELRDALAVILEEQVRAVRRWANRPSRARLRKKAAMSKVHPSEGRSESPTLAEQIAGVLPFVLVGLTMINYVSNGVVPQWGWYRGKTWLLVISEALLAIGVCVGWIAGFPRWSWPYLGFTVFFALWLSDASTPGLTLLGHAFARGERWGWRAWIPLGAAAAVGLLVTRSLHPIVRLGAGIWHDWTRLSFALYGAAPLLMWAMFDEVNNRWEFPFTVAWTIALTVGALAYMRSLDTRRRALSLAMGLALAAAVAIAGTSIYWHGRMVGRMTHPINGYVEALRGLVAMPIMVGLLLAPGLLGLLRTRRSRWAA